MPRVNLAKYRPNNFDHDKDKDHVYIFATFNSAPITTTSITTTTTSSTPLMTTSTVMTTITTTTYTTTYDF